MSGSIKGNWKQLKGEAQRKWGELTKDELDKIDGDATNLKRLINDHPTRCPCCGQIIDNQ